MRQTASPPYQTNGPKQLCIQRADVLGGIADSSYKMNHARSPDLHLDLQATFAAARTEQDLLCFQLIYVFTLLSFLLSSWLLLLRLCRLATNFCMEHKVYVMIIVMHLQRFPWQKLQIFRIFCIYTE